MTKLKLYVITPSNDYSQHIADYFRHKYDEDLVIEEMRKILEEMRKEDEYIITNLFLQEDEFLRSF